METLSERYIDEIASGLIEHHAAVLVGAGFSRNADTANDSVTEMMPLWGKLTDMFCDRLGIAESERKYMSTLAIAQQMAETFGRPCLDNTIKSAMNDEVYVPSDIHRALVSLHWTDIFTTNYDTLLERACVDVTDRKYHIVRNQDDLIYSAGLPRIIKLHGSFPSNGPFIITEEDFREYPHDHAPFVNTVQQSMLENTFCLIGFSGDDPNFLKWIGWIHDNLGLDHSPIIYLITHKQVTQAKINDLVSKKIRVINLYEIQKYVDSTLIPESVEYTREIYRRFLEDLRTRSDEVYRTIQYWPGSDWDKFFDGSCSSIEDIHASLIKVHDSYPGWIVAPFDRHASISRLISGIEQTYFNKVRFSKGQRVSVAEGEKLLKRAQEKDRLITKEKMICLCLDIVYEYVWLYSIIGRPIPIQYISDLTPFADEYTHLSNDYKTSERDKKLHFIYFEFMRSYRIHGYDDEWKKLYNSVSKLHLSINEHNALIYEDIYHDICNLEFGNINNKADGIVADAHMNIWALRKASIWALTGRYSEAVGLLHDAINNLRYEDIDISAKSDIREQSIESCLITLYNFAVQARDTSSGVFKDYSKEDSLLDDSKNRFISDFIWEHDNTRYADFLTDIYYLESNNRTSPAYDIGSSTTSVRFGGSNKDFLTAIEFIGFREATGIPFRISNVVNKRGVMGAAKRIAPYSALYPIVLSVLTQDDKIISQIWSRNYMSGLTVKDADGLVDLCNSALNTALDNIDASTNIFFNKKLIEFPLTIMPEILSRLCSRCSPDKFSQILKTIVRLYSFHDNRSMPDVRALTRRYIRCVPLKLLLENMDVFWQLPLISDLYELSHFCEPFHDIYYRLDNIKTICGVEENLSLTEQEKGFIKLLFSECVDQKDHKAVIKRLTYLSQIYDFADDIQKKFDEIIFSPANMSGGNPYLGDFDISSISMFSQRKLSSDAKAQRWDEIIKQLEDSSVPGIYTDYSSTLNTAALFVQQNNLTSEQIISLSDVLLKFCKKFVDYIKDDSRYTGVVKPHCISNLQSAGVLMGETLLSAGEAVNINADGNKECIQIRDSLESADIPCSLLSYCLDQDDNKAEHFVDNALSGDDRHVSEGMNAIYTLDRYGIHIQGRLSDILIDALYTGTSYDAYVKVVEFYIRKGQFSDKELCRVDGSLPKYLLLTSFSNSDSEKEISDKIFLRNCIANLAHTMDLHKGKNDLPGVAEWKTANAAPEEFAEIRNSWDEL